MENALSAREEIDRFNDWRRLVIDHACPMVVPLFRLLGIQIVRIAIASILVMGSVAGFAVKADELSVRELLARHDQPPRITVLRCPQVVQLPQRCDDLVHQALADSEGLDLLAVQFTSAGSGGMLGSNLSKCSARQFALTDEMYSPEPIVPRGPFKVFDLDEAQLVVASGYRQDGAAADLAWRGYFIVPKREPCSPQLFEYVELNDGFGFVEAVNRIGNQVSLLALHQQDGTDSFYSGFLYIFAPGAKPSPASFTVNF